MCFKTLRSDADGCLLNANPTFLPLQYMVHNGVAKRDLSGDASESFEHSRAILRLPLFISRARKVVEIVSSRRRTGFCDLGFVWIQKLTFPVREPKMVPVILVAVVGKTKEEGLRWW